MNGRGPGPDQPAELEDLTSSLLQVRDLIRECGRQERERERKERLDAETWKRLRKLMPPALEEARPEPVAGPRRLDLRSGGPRDGSDRFELLGA